MSGNLARYLRNAAATLEGLTSELDKPGGTERAEEVREEVDLLCTNALREAQGKARMVARHPRSATAVGRLLRSGSEEACSSFLAALVPREDDVVGCVEKVLRRREEDAEDEEEGVAQNAATRVIEQALLGAGAEEVLRVARPLLADKGHGSADAPFPYLSAAAATALCTRCGREGGKALAKWAKRMAGAVEENAVVMLAEPGLARLMQAFAVATTLRRLEAARDAITRTLERLPAAEFAEAACAPSGARWFEAWFDAMTTAPQEAVAAPRAAAKELADAVGRVVLAQLPRAMATLAAHEHGSYVVRRALDVAPSQAMVRSLMQPLMPVAGEVVAANRMVVLAHAASAIARVALPKDDAKAFVRAVQKALVPEARKRDAFPAAALLDDHGRLGPVLLAALLRLPAPAAALVVDAMLRWDAAVWEGYMCSGPSSRAVEAFVGSPGLVAARRAQWITGFVGRFADLAMNRSASHVVEAMFNEADVDTKVRMLDDLAQHVPRLMTASSGKWILKTCRVQLYLRKRDDWTRDTSSRATRKRLFDDLLSDMSDIRGAKSETAKRPKTVNDNHIKDMLSVL